MAKADQPTYSFMSMVKKTGAVPGKTQSARTGDPLQNAKGKILSALDEQIGYVGKVEGNHPLPKAKDGKRNVSTWFSNSPDGYWTTIRYGQLMLPITPEGGMLIGSADELTTFFEAVKTSIRNGELDAMIGKMQSERSAALKGKAGGRKKAA